MSLSNHLTLAATRVEEISMSYRPPVQEESDFSIVWWMSVPFIALAVVLLMRRMTRRRMHTAETPNELLKELCYAHRIDSTGRNLLGVVAEKAKLQAPATMFLSMNMYDNAMQAAEQHVKFDRHDQSTLKMLRRQLFSSNR